MKITLRDFVDGNEKATLQFASYGVPRPVYSVGTSEGAVKGWDERGRGRKLSTTKNAHFRTEQYRASHGKEPKGHGHWAFGIGNDNPKLEEIQGHRGHYGEAKATMSRKFTGQTIHVLP